MRRKRTSTFYFPYSCLEVWQAVTAGNQDQGFSYRPIPDEEFEESRIQALKNGKVLARVTDMTEAVSCAYTLYAQKFTVDWRAEFSTVGNDECRMTMTECYEFPPHSIGQYILAILFLRQRQQHKAFREEIERRLRKQYCGG